jgi:murein DD-endopeptidase MepM/ murein hydrolase activator NlpD
MPTSRASWVIAVTAALSLAAAPTRRAAVSIRWTPDRPVQGTLIRLTAEDDDRADPIWSIEGELAGERLHFESDDAGTLAAFAGIPVDAAGPLQLKVRVQRTGRVDSVLLEMPIARGNFKRERLTVARRFTDPPDSALQARIEQEAALVAAVYRRSHGTPRLWKGPFEQPRQSRISSVFGTGREFNGVLQSRHLGTDFTGRVGDPIRAANDGVVSLVGDLYYSGNAIFMDHGRGIVTAYLHMSETLVAVGDTVEKGQVIGKVGMTGRVTGPHLHWIAKYGRISVDPMSLLGLVEATDERRDTSDSTVVTSASG